MNKQDILIELVDRADLALAKAEAALRALTEVLAEALEKGDSVHLRGFGSFHRITRGATTARNPRTGEPVAVPERHTVRFRLAQVLSDRLNRA